MHGDLFIHNRNESCIKTKVLAKDCVKNIKLENLGTELVVICQAKFDARFVESLCQEKYATIKKTSLQLMRLWICIVTVVIVW